MSRYFVRYGHDSWMEIDFPAWLDHLDYRGLPPDAYQFNDQHSRGRIVNRIIGIIGSTQFVEPIAENRAREIIHARLTYHDPPDALVSGGAKGVDTWAEGQAQALGLVTIIHHPIVHGWAIPGGYRDRNLRIAHDCDYLVRIACRDSSTYGSGYTADVAQRLGKPVERITL